MLCLRHLWVFCNNYETQSINNGARGAAQGGLLVQHEQHQNSSKSSDTKQ